MSTFRDVGSKTSLAACRHPLRGFAWFDLALSTGSRTHPWLSAGIPPGIQTQNGDAYSRVTATLRGIAVLPYSDRSNSAGNRFWHIAEDRGRNTEYVMDMTFIKKSILILWVASCVVWCSAQDKKGSAWSRPDLSGTWVRSLYKSNHRGQLENYPVTLTISHKEPELKITRKSVLQGKEKITDEAYYTDGRGEKNVAQFQSALAVGSSPTSGIVQKGANDPQTKSKTKWESSKLVSRSSTSLEAVGHRFYIETAQKRELSADGKTLTITTTIMPGGSTSTEVFDRVQ